MKIWTLHNEVLEPIEEAVNNHYDKLDTDIVEDIENALQEADKVYNTSMVESEAYIEELQTELEETESNLKGLLGAVQESLNQLVNHMTTDTLETQNELKGIINMIYKGT